MIDLNFKYKELLKILEGQSPFTPDVSLILGSGLGDFIKNTNVKKTFPTKELPGYPPSTIHGHEGKIHFTELDGKNLLIFQGRIHLYEGYSIYETILPVFISYKLGCKNLLLTNAAGGVNKDFTPGDLILTTSFNGIFIKKELTKLIGVASLNGKNNFLNLPSKKLNDIIKQAAQSEKIELKEGIYWYTRGPSYETPAEIKMVERFNGDAVGMSTVHEAVFSSYLGIETAAISCITNYAAGISAKKLSHKDVTETANMVKEKFQRLVTKIISLI